MLARLLDYVEAEQGLRKRIKVKSLAENKYGKRLVAATAFAQEDGGLGGSDVRCCLNSRADKAEPMIREGPTTDKWARPESGGPSSMGGI